MPHSSPRNQLLTLVVTLAGSIGLFMAPATVTTPIRATVRDSVLPGHHAVEFTFESVYTVVARVRGDEPDVLDLKSTADASRTDELQLRQLQLENARLRERIEETKRVGVSPYQTGAANPLLLDDLIAANVFGKETATLWKSGVLIDKGRGDDLRASDVVLKDDGSLIDAGTDVRLETGFPVFTGRCVFGRVSHVGRWTSTIEHVSDLKFRGQAQVVRKSSDGFHFGAQGVLEGTGDGKCRLNLIAAAAPVAVGDDVYTNSEKGTFPYPMYYGRITRAELKPGDSHWQIEVAPAVSDTPPQHVQILRKRLNPERSNSQ